MKPYYEADGITIYHGDCRDVLRDLEPDSIQTCVTSPPYFGLRDYGHEAQIGLEPTHEAYVAQLVAVFRDVRRVLPSDGTLWLNLGDSYTGSASTGGTGKETAYTGKRSLPSKSGVGLKPKDLIGIPWRVAFALQTDGWYLRQDIIWHKPNPMPESVTDRCTKAHEYIFLLSKSDRYYYNAEAISEPSIGGIHTRSRASNFKKAGKVGNHTSGSALIECDGTRNRRSVWTVTTKPYAEAHFATFPEDLILPCILAGSRPGDTVLDPFMGSGTTAYVSRKHGRATVGCELNADYIELSAQRLAQRELGLIPEPKPELEDSLDLFESPG